MKQLSVFHKVLFFFNIILAFFTLLAYLLPFLAPSLFPELAVITLVLPLFILVHLLVVIYWIFLYKKQFWLSLIIILLGIPFINKFYKFSGLDLLDSPDDITIMSYNVRLFNVFDWISNPNVAQSIEDLVAYHQPDILCIQEFTTSATVHFLGYPHKYIMMEGDNIKTGQAIFSKFPIINSGNLPFQASNNNAVFADLLVRNDTIRVYSAHLESTKISPDLKRIESEYDDAKSLKIFRRIRAAFQKQQQQSEVIKQHKATCKYPTVVASDLNNSAFSYVYKTIKGTMQDTFEEAGKGFGRTYDFEFYPARIDFIFADQQFEVKNFKNLDKSFYSDHFPIVARIRLKKQDTEVHVKFIK